MIHQLVEVDDGGSAGCFFTALKIHNTLNKNSTDFLNALTWKYVKQVVVPDKATVNQSWWQTQTAVMQEKQLAEFFQSRIMTKEVIVMNQAVL